eukprot:6340493-Heterocapsa_arctica.AAC.1
MPAERNRDVVGELRAVLLLLARGVPSLALRVHGAHPLVLVVDVVALADYRRHGRRVRPQPLQLGARCPPPTQHA